MLDLIIKNGFCYIDNDLKDKDIGIKNGKIEELLGNDETDMAPGDTFIMETPGGGAYGAD